ncbi:MAG: type II toxin-antitoxin system antitoxin SocA domain-containing protein [Candidatus Omnitrophota bacterium]
MEPVVISEYYLSKEAMDHKKLQKLCYYAQCWYYGLFQKKLMSTDFEAWIHGPVSPTMYHHYKQHSWLPIKNSLNPEIDIDIKEFLDEIFNIYGKFSGEELEILTHSEIPWIRARGTLSPTEPCNNPISYDDMLEYCKELLKESDQ